MKFTEKIVIGTAQFGMDYGIANDKGKPNKNEVFNILNLALENGVRHFDTAPGYGSEALLGEFILANGIQDEAIVLTKIPSLDGVTDFQVYIRKNLEMSLKHLSCPVDVLFFHVPEDSLWLLKDPQFFEKLLQEYPVSTLGVSVYKPQEVERMSGCLFNLSFQFPFNVLDRRFEQVSMPKGKRYARSIFLQGLLVSQNGLRPNAPKELIELQREYHGKLADHHLAPIGFAISFATRSDAVDYFLIGLDSVEQLEDILNLDSYNQKDIAMFDDLPINTDKHWFDPRNWSSI